MRKLIWWVLCWGMIWGTAQGEELLRVDSGAPLTLDSLVSLGIRHNPQVRQSEMNQRLNGIGELAAIGRFLPSISLGLDFSESKFENRTFRNPDGSVSTLPVTFQDVVIVPDSAGNLVLDTITVTQEPSEGKSRSSSWSVNANLSLFEGGQRIFLYRIAQAQKKINTLSVEDAHKTLTRTVAQQVVGVLTLEKVVELNKRLRDQRKDAYDLAKARFEVGAVTELDVLQAEIELGTAENAIASSERELEKSRETLNQTLGIDLRSRFPIAEANGLSPYQFELDQLVADAYQNRTDLEISWLRLKSARDNVKYARGAYLPRISIGASRAASEQSGADEAFTLSPRNRNTTYYGSLSWNLFDGFAREYDVASKRIDLRRAEETERELRLSIEKNVREAYRNLETVYDQMQTTNRNRELANRTLELERERYRLGATSALSLRDAQVTNERAETDHLQKELEYQSSLIALELAVGKSLR
ncbi:MAG: TolC family protein [Calditrichaeota bacterium]|nr:TolC family protein [Calditrichota bacterium]MCB9391823.1 TolC family protein [Calditrichota bacterium]